MNYFYLIVTALYIFRLKMLKLKKLRISKKNLKNNHSIQQKKILILSNYQVIIIGKFTIIKSIKNKMRNKNS